MIAEKIQNLIEKAAKKTFPQIQLVEIQTGVPEEKNHGHYTTNLSMILAKKIGQNPLEIAETLKKEILKIEPGLFEKIEVLSPGFLNFFLKKEVFISELRKILAEKEKYGSKKKKEGKTIIIDYSSPNIAKPFGIGHLRSTIIGQALANIYRVLGFRVVGDNHLGDWGTQFGKLIFAIKEWGNPKEVAKNPIKELNNLYVKFHREAEKKPELEEKGRQWFKKLEAGDEEAKKIWQKCVKWTLEEFERIYKLLEIKIDLALGESFYQPMVKEIITEALKKKVAKESQGAIIISFPKDALPPFMIKKSDGATLYSTRDLATIKYRLKRFKPFKVIYEVGADQTLHFKQLFWAVELLGWAKREKFFHVAHGLMRLESGKMKTRKGETILLEDVLKEVINRARKIVEVKNPNLNQKEKERISQVVGIGAIKYSDLSQHYSKDIIFDWGKILNLEGNSGPYLQYAFARSRGILKKARIKELKNVQLSDLKDERELALLRSLSWFPEVIEKAGKTYSPNLIANFLFKLTKNFNVFYESLPVLKAKGELKKARLALVLATGQVIKNGLSLLGIKTLEKI